MSAWATVMIWHLCVLLRNFMSALLFISKHLLKHLLILLLLRLSHTHTNKKRNKRWGTSKNKNHRVCAIPWPWPRDFSALSWSLHSQAQLPKPCEDRARPFPSPKDIRQNNRRVRHNYDTQLGPYANGAVRNRATVQCLDIASINLKCLNTGVRTSLSVNHTHTHTHTHTFPAFSMAFVCCFSLEWVTARLI